MTPADVVGITTPDSGELWKFCEENNVPPASLFKLAWAIVLHTYFDTRSFLVKEELRDSTNKSGLKDIGVINFAPDLSKTTPTLSTLQNVGTKNDSPEVGLHQASPNGYDNSLVKLRSELQIIHRESDEIGRNSYSANDFKQSQITVIIELSRSKSTGFIYYDPKLNEINDLNNSARVFAEVVKSILTNAAPHIDDINLVSEYDKAKVLESNSKTLSSVIDCMHLLVCKTVAERPDDTALISWDGQLTYRELDRYSSILARHLIEEFGIGPEKVVPLCFEKSIWAVIAMLGVLKAGAAYCCIDPALPAARRNYMIELVDGSLVLTSPIYSELMVDFPTFAVDADLFSGLNYPETLPSSGVKPTNTCVIAFSSGTTGKPKAITHTHISVCSGIDANAPVQGLNQVRKRVFQWAAYTFDVSITETFSPLIHGGTVCIPSEEERLNNVDECMIRMDVDWAYFTPTFARFFRQYTIPTLKTLILGGEAVTIDDVRGWVNKVRVLNAYGPAEAITWFLEPQAGISNTISIGRPINMYGWIVNPDNSAQLMPIGAIGELLLEGPSLFEYYIKNPEKTEQQLIEPPPWRIAGNLTYVGKMYKTGDLVRYLPDGTMTYVGRKDTMVKLYGQRMELEEVEVTMRRHIPEGINCSADVITPAGDKEEPALVAFLSTPPHTPDFNFHDLRIHLQTKIAESLPGFMVPRIYIPMETLPYNSSRKLDRTKLRQYASSLTRGELVDLIKQPETEKKEENESETLTPVESELQQLWATALSLEPSQVRLDNNFFSLGGNSVHALKVTSRARDKGIIITHADLFRAPSLRALAKAAKTGSSSAETSTPPFSLIDDSVRSAVIADAVAQCEVPEEAIEDIYPQAPQQQGLWALSLAHDGAYLGQFILEVSPEADLERLLSAWEAVLKHLPTLRTRFIETESGSYQVVVKEEIQWQSSDRTEEYLAADVQNNEVEFGKPLVRHAVISEDGKHKIVWSIHHALYDGDSVPMFLNMVSKAYDGVLPDPQAGPFNHFIKYTMNLDLESASKYWQSQFDPINPVQYPALPSPTYRPNPASIHRRPIRFARRLASTITTATLLRAAWSLTVANAAKSAEVSVGVTLAGRTAPVPNIETVVGPTFVTLPTRVAYDPSDSVVGYLQRTQSYIVDMMQFEHTGIQKIQEFSSQCQSACQFQNILLVQTEGDLSYRKLLGYDDTTGGFGRFNSHSLMLLLFPSNEGVDAVFSFDSSVISGERVAQIDQQLEHFIHILCLEEDNRPISSVLSSEVSQEFNATGVVQSYQESKEASEEVSKPKEMPNGLPNGTASAQKSPPSTEQEILLAKLWADVLRISQADAISVTDEFFSTYGGNSLFSLNLVQRCQKNGYRLTVKQIFQHPRLADMANTMKKIAAGEKKAAIIQPFALLEPNGLSKKAILPEAAQSCGVSEETIVDIYPCTPLQEGLLAVSQTQPGSYISKTVHELADGIDIARFRLAWAKVYRDMEILRTKIFQLTSPQKSLQVVLSSDMEWQESTSLPQYLEETKDIEMGFGTALNQFAIIYDENSAKTYFSLIIHHAQYDGWSMPLMFNRVYQSYIEGSTVPRGISFNNFVQVVTSQNPSKQEEFWRTQFTDASPIHFPEPSPSGSKPGSQINIEHSIKVSKPKNSSIITSTILRAAWAMLLGSYTNSEDVTFGATLSGRNLPLPGIENLAAPTLTTVPVRVQFERTEQVSDFLRRVQDQVTDMIEFEHSGLQSIRKHFPEVCNFENLLVIQPRGKEMDQSRLWTATQLGDTSRFLSYPLVLQCTLEDDIDTIQVTATYDPKRIAHTQMDRILKQYGTAVSQLMSAEDKTTLAQLNLISADDEQTLKDWLQERPAPEIVDRCLHALITDQVYDHPKSLAITSSEGQELTYGELYEFSCRLRHLLAENGAHPGMKIPIVFDKSIWAIVAMTAVLYSGAAFVPIDPDHPASRRNALFDQLNPSIILSSPKYADLFKTYTTFGVDRGFLEKLPSVRNGERKYSPVLVSPTDPAYVLFTSGSTGIPKGVVISHGTVSSSVKAHGGAMGMSENTRALQFCSYTFDVCIAEIFATLVFGGTICIPTPEGRMNNLAGEIQILKPNWAFLTPSVARLVDPSEVPSLEILVLGGEEVKPSDSSRWNGSKVRLMNGYGPTEACVFCVTSDIDTTAHSRTIGRAIGCSAYITDPEDHTKLAPIGTIGELLVAGPILATGYLNSPETTSKVFIQAPAWAERVKRDAVAPRRFYKTGDLVRYDHCGEIEYMRRKDTQVKVGGQRVEVDDINHWILTDSEVNHSLVLLPKSGLFSARKQLVAVFSKKQDTEFGVPLKLVPNAISQPKISSLKSTLADNLPTYAVPAIWMAVEKIPLSAAGKIDRRRVREWVENISKEEYLEVTAANTQNSSSVQPKGPLEEKLQTIWASVLEIPVESVSADRSFFSYGGDSISAIRVVKQCRKQLIDASIQDLMIARGISHLAKIVNSKESTTIPVNPPAKAIISPMSTEAVAQAAKISNQNPENIENIMRSTPLQEAMLSKRSEGFYNLEMLLEIESREPLDINRLQGAWNQVLKRHAALRTIFVEQNGRADQIILKDIESTLSVEEVEEIRSRSRESSINRKPAYPQNGPYHKLSVVKSEGKPFVKIEIFHGLTDAVSLGTVFRDLALAYDSKLPSTPAPQFSEYINYITNQSEQGTKYWNEYSAGALPSLIALTPETDATEMTLLHTDVEIARQSEIASFCRHHGISIANFFHATWALVLKSYIPSKEVTFGYLVSGRDIDIDGVEETVGGLLSALVSRQAVDDQTSLTQLLTRIRDDSVQSSGHKFCDIAKINPLFNTMVNFRKYPTPVKDADISISFEYREGFDPWGYDITLLIQEGGDKMDVSLAHWNTAFSAAKGKEIGDCFGKVVEGVLGDASQSVRSLLGSVRA
ncbi:putative nonribosomal peptide synthase [Patellaria atrata CBS 101060]|uniref:Nonribosomal peptide synthase n=1 Tax=Patellaria atrata CBS 101060 TaxID=1346257 RepID=A0A9P4SC85_9PEZI|nr:putative nonribosomal peptide synthase [Patellaria atrata CBS 101060]